MAWAAQGGETPPVRICLAGCGWAGLGSPWHGPAGLGGVRRGQARFGEASQGTVRHGTAWAA